MTDDIVAQTEQVTTKIRDAVERNRVTWEPSIAEAHRLLDEFAEVLLHGEFMRVMSTAAGLHAVVDSLTEWTMKGLISQVVTESMKAQVGDVADLPEPIRGIVAALRGGGAEVEVIDNADLPGHYV